jgi:hypothetical protein
MTLVEPSLDPQAEVILRIETWLGASQAEMTTMLGLGKGPIRHPLDQGARLKLARADALAGALVQRMGEAKARGWLNEPGRRGRFLGGDTIGVQREARDILFPKQSNRPRPGSWSPPLHLIEPVILSS